MANLNYNPSLFRRNDPRNPMAQLPEEEMPQGQSGPDLGSLFAKLRGGVPEEPLPQQMEGPRLENRGEPIADQLNAEPKEEGFFSKIKNKLTDTGSGQPVEYDEYGNPKPQEQKRSLLSKIMSTAIPAIAGTALGVGPIPGLMAGLAGNQARNRQDADDAQDRYQKTRAASALNDYRDRGLEIKEDHNKALEGYYGTMGKAAQTRAGAAVTNAVKPRNDSQRYSELLSHMGKRDLTLPEIAELRALKKIMEKKGTTQTRKEPSDLMNQIKSSLGGAGVS